MENHMHSQYDVDSNRWLVPCFLMFDCVTVLCLAGLVYFFGFTEHFEPASRGFFCHDTALSMPLPKDEVAPEYALYTTAFLVPIVIVVIAETCIALKPNSKQQLSLYGQKNIRSCNIHLKTVLRRIIRFTGISLFGGLVTWLMTIGLQLVTGQQTPFFIAACKPNWSLLNCSEFVTNYTCTSSDMDLSRKARFIWARLAEYGVLVFFRLFSDAVSFQLRCCYALHAFRRTGITGVTS
ncbi:phospholipid phosphatase-related protein type 1-like [Anneissia japonica]|uniref:phospholipid phosphatase-related protein type 1-like n=1 Tax=Anneissia japonica TaxID=1529436 RepID=UPI0014257B8E|nr:phospholipid phosphatase-related protein type 1-like [Anneissia japonica]XP_033111670.1 phospholipid phosphatase-related protein type 1-like [Anneissia japonica]